MLISLKSVNTVMSNIIPVFISLFIKYYAFKKYKLLVFENLISI